MGMLQEFKTFAIKGNVVDLAIGVIIGAAFGKITESLVRDVIMPVVGLVVGRRYGWAELVVAGCVLLGIVFAMIFAAAGYAATRGQRDFSSVQKVVATKYEVLVEHKFLSDGTALLATMPGATGADPFA